MPAPKNVVKPAQRIVIPHTSWASTLFWWKRRLLKPIRNLIAWWRGHTVPIPPKGPQIWLSPPHSKHLNRLMKNGEECVVGQWEEEVSGWTVTVVRPPQVNIDGGRAIKRSIFYLYGSGFQSPM